MEILDGIHRIEAEVGGRPLYLFLFLGERRLLLDAGCSTTVQEFVVPYRADHGIGYDDDTLRWIREMSGFAESIDIGWVGGELLRLSRDWELSLFNFPDPYLETAAAIDSLAPAELHGCHWPARRGREVAAFIGESRAYVERIDGLVSAAVGDQPRTLRALIAQVNERLDEPWPLELEHELVYSVHGHVERLVERGRATADRDANGHVVYRSAE